uniref:Uncharacterized protein n=1 Tax=Steinernema glaseri TaxID=37863 RepID=A0A1I7Z0R0_9BILA
MLLVSSITLGAKRPGANRPRVPTVRFWVQIVRVRIVRGCKPSGRRSLGLGWAALNIPLSQVLASVLLPCSSPRDP